jgi:hypothetical protein
VNSSTASGYGAINSSSQDNTTESVSISMAWTSCRSRGPAGPLFLSRMSPFRSTHQTETTSRNKRGPAQRHLLEMALLLVRDRTCWPTEATG